MAVSYDVFEKEFRDKITDYDFPFKEDSVRQDMVDGYLRRALSQFSRLCRYDLSDRDDESRAVNISPDSKSLDEIADIVSEGMIAQWLKPYAYKSELLENLINTTDFTSYSPANLLEKVQAAHTSAVRAYTNLLREYSYNHNDLTKLWS